MKRSRQATRSHRTPVRSILVLFCLLYLAVGTGVPALAEGPVRVCFGPSSAHPAVGEIVQIDIRLENAVDLYGAQVIMTFNPAVLEVVDDDPLADGVQIAGNDGFWDGQQTVGCPLCNQADNINGQITYAVFLSQPEHGVTGSGALASIRFRVKAAGLSKLTFDPAGTSLPYGIAQRPASLVLIGGHIGSGTHELYLPIGAKLH